MSDDHVFADEQFMSANQKAKVFQAWSRFLKSGCAKSQFSQNLYHHLTLHCSFIAHFDRHGFYNFYFECLSEDLFRFFDQFDPAKPGISAEYGTPYWLSNDHTAADLNRAMRDVAGAYLNSLRATFSEIRRQREIGAASLVLANYGLSVVPATDPMTAPSEMSRPTQSSSSRQGTQARLFPD